MKAKHSSANPARRSESGQGIVIVMSIVGVLGLLGASVSGLNSTTSRHRARTLALAQAQSLGEGALEIAYAQWRRYAGLNIVDVRVDVDLNGKISPTSDLATNDDLSFIEQNPPDQHPAFAAHFAGFNLTEYRVVALDAAGRELTAKDATPTGVEIVEGDADDPGALINSYFRYRAYVTVEVPSVAGGQGLGVRVTRDFEVIKGSNYTDFTYSAPSDPNNPLEIFPGPRMDITGSIFANTDLYYGHSSLWFHEPVMTAGNAYNEYYKKTYRGTQTPSQANFVDNAGFGPQTGLENRQLLGESEDILVGDGTNPNSSSGLRELIELPDPTYEDPPQIAERRLSNNSEIQILIDSSKTPDDPNRIKVLVLEEDQQGTKTHKEDTGAIRDAVLAGLGYVDENGQPIPDVNGGVQIRDNREKHEIFLTDVDVEVLTQNLIDADAPVGETGMGIYITDISQKGSAPSDVPIYDPATDSYETQQMKKAIRLRNGDTLPDYKDFYGNRLGFTFSSQNGIYVQGDFNTGPNPPSNNPGISMPTTDDTTAANEKYESFTTAPGYERAPVMVAADAVMILSNAWQDSDSYLDVGNSDRRADHTTMNFAIVSGNVQPESNQLNGGKDYSGGLENFPRFMEKWGKDRNFTYYGTMILGYYSGQFTGAWGKGNVYDPPRRRWFFEMIYRKATGLPEDFIIKAGVSYRKGRVFIGAPGQDPVSPSV